MCPPKRDMSLSARHKRAGQGLCGVKWTLARRLRRRRTAMDKTVRLILLVILILLLIAMLPAWPYSAGWGYYPSGGLGVVLLILIVLLVAGRL